MRKSRILLGALIERFLRMRIYAQSALLRLHLNIRLIQYLPGDSSAVTNLPVNLVLLTALIASTANETN